MGNKEHVQNDDFSQMVKQMRKDQSRRVSIHPQKYLQRMLQELPKTKLHDCLKDMIQYTLNEKVTQVELIESITCINALRNNQFEITHMRGTSALREKPESKYVKINFGQNFIKKILRKLNINILEQQEDLTQRYSQDMSPPILQKKRSINRTNNANNPNSNTQDDSQIKEKLKNIAQVMKKQLNRISHPFGKLNKTFAQYIEEYSCDIFPKGRQQTYQKMVKQIITEWVSYLECSCLNPYRKWIISYTGLQELKYTRWIKNLILQQIWAVNNGYLFSMLSIVIHSKMITLGIDKKHLQSNASLLTPSLFCIDPKLQIQGHFFDSIYQMSQVVSKFRPQQILTQLQVVKKRICTDIDNYHRLVERNQIFQIDSDNILGIVSYILCKIASKIDQIYAHLIFLRIIYGQQVYYSMGNGSYMLSTIFGAIEFLESIQFRRLIDEKKDPSKVISLCMDQDKSAPNHSQTKGTLSQKQENQEKLPGLNEQPESLRVCSMVVKIEEDSQI